MTKKSTGGTRRNKQVGLYQAKNFPHSKGNNKQNKKAYYGMGEKICKQYLR